MNRAVSMLTIDMHLKAKTKGNFYREKFCIPSEKLWCLVNSFFQTNTNAKCHSSANLYKLWMNDYMDINKSRQW